MNRPTRAAAVLLLAACSAVATGGCTNQGTEQAANSRLNPVATGDVAVAPKELVEQVKRVVSAPPLSLGVESHDRGTIVTGWKPYQGDLHIVRHWQERTRYRIEVVPDWSEPTAKSRLNVTAETEQRPAEGQSWDREPRVPRPARAQEMLDQIVQQLRATGGK